MTRVWSMASEQSDTQDFAQIQNAIICISQERQQMPSAPLVPSVPPAPPPPPLPPDTDSGYEASPSSATRLVSFQFNQTEDNSANDEELLSIDVLLAPIMLYESGVDLDRHNEEDTSAEESTDEEEYGLGFGSSLAALHSYSSSSGSDGSDRSISTPIPIPSASRLTRSPQAIHSTHANAGQCQTLPLQSLSSIASFPLPSSLSSSLSLSGRNYVEAVGSDGIDDYGIGAMMLAHNRHRYSRDIGGGMLAISPHSPPSSHTTYWSPYIIGIVGPTRPTSHNHHHYGQSATIESSVSTAQSIAALPTLHTLQTLQTLPSIPSLPSPLSSLSLSSRQMRGRDASQLIRECGVNDNNSNPLPDVVNVERPRIRVANGHSHARRATSICLPIDAELVRDVAISLRRISDDFERSRASIHMLSNSEPGSYGMVSNIFASVRLSRRSVSSRFRSHYINANSRQRSFSTNDAPQQ